jgi:type I restriction enzyme, S subunit
MTLPEPTRRPHRRSLRSSVSDALHLPDQLPAETFGDPLTNSKGWPNGALLGEHAEIVSGITKGRRLNGKPTREVPYLTVYNVQDRALRLDQVKTIEATEDEIERYRLKKDDLLLTEGGDPDKLGRGTLWNDELPESIHQNHIFRVRLRSSELDAVFLNWLVGSERGKRYFLRSAKQTTGIASINMGQLRSFPLLLPPLAEQRRIAAILDAADALRQKRRQALRLLDHLSQAIFVEMFGDPALNPCNWKLMPLGELSTKFSDGPFGSNLKSEHYVPSGIRVIRLQNIGVGSFNDGDRAYISERHFRSLQKHECRPGDVLIGTLGDPNLRACIQPESIPTALNKADCVQMRCNPKLCTAEYITALLNSPPTERMAQSKIQGQTRLRISMGRLRELEVPLPPLELQETFAEKIAQLRRLKQQTEDGAATLDRLFASLQHRAFRGEL